MVTPKSSRRAMAKRRQFPGFQSFLGRLMGCLSPKPFTESTPTFTCANEHDIDIPDNCHTSTFAVSTAETAWNAHGNEDMHLEMLTEVVDGRLRGDSHHASTQMDFSTLLRGTS
ncbi:hypothetical protein JB92DRAFT_2838742 [Gautieria morchelliformis]|nr:hypothetical protein JB92DRAFT_2838742 [Gautieria morchelliformis]